MGDLADKVIAAYEGLAIAAFINDIITITIILITVVYKCIKQETTWFIWLQIGMLLGTYVCFLIRDTLCMINNDGQAIMD